MDAAAILVSQYQASLEMLKQAVVKCPEWMWNTEEDRNKFWHTVYHTLFFTHLQLEVSEEDFVPWHKHRPGYEDFDVPAGSEPYAQDELLEYLAFCRQHVAVKVPQLKLDELEGHGDRTLLNLELQIYSIRHLMQHVGELLERLGSRAGVEIDWVGWKHNPAQG